jgi:hypothetical protein
MPTLFVTEKISFNKGIKENKHKYIDQDEEEALEESMATSKK